MAAANGDASPLPNEIQNYLRVTRDDIRVVSQRDADGLTRTLLVMQTPYGYKRVAEIYAPAHAQNCAPLTP